MWNEIIEELTKEIPTIWLEGVKEKSFKDDTLTLTVPDRYYANKYIDNFKPLIQSVIKTKTGKDIGLQCQIELLLEPVMKDEKLKAIMAKTPLIKSKEFNGKPYYKNYKEIVLVAKEAKQIKIKEDNIKKVELTSMPTKYGIENVATFNLFNSKMFTYPNDKRKKAKVSMKIRFNDGTSKEYELYRGQIARHNDTGTGQLTTTHAKIFLAITHIWQEQKSRFANDSYCAVVDTSLTEIAKKLGYKKVSGADRSRILQKIKEMVYFYMMVSDGVRDCGFSLLNNIIVWDKEDRKENNYKSTIRISISPFVSKQLYDRKIIMRKPQCYKIKNPTAIKFLLCYDKRIVAGNSLKMNISEVANDLEINISTNKSMIIEVLNNALKELNGYELNDRYRLYVELVKEEREWIVIAERISKEKQQPLKALLA
ncbi:hypothetical protein AGMMS49573_03810 [Endomicrobiia bacterium]|nr:hypothetical protein AGMMS49573_03810 [Endomicrobiia bacterium]